MIVAPRDFEPALKGIAGRPERGRWFRAIPARRIHELLDPSDSTPFGGRMHPAGSFPVLYAASDEKGRRPSHRHDPGRLPGIAIAVFSVTLQRVLDLGNPSIRRRLHVALWEITDSADMRISQSIGVAAYNEGFQGIVYPRSACPRCRNLAMFGDHITSNNIQLLELRTPLPARASRKRISTAVRGHRPDASRR